MGNIISMPQVENFTICKDCGNDAWRICWPQNNKGDTFILCLNCGSEFNIEMNIEKLHVPEDTP